MGLSEAEFQALYGVWAPLSLSEVARLLDGITWWVVGGYAIELAGGPRRPHGDLDVAVPRSDLERVVERLTGFHLWTANSGALKPLSWFERMPDDHHQLWVRRDAQSPWVLDLQLQPVEGDEWVYRKDARIRIPMGQAVRTRDGVPYLAPQIVLLHKAHLCRQKDDADLDAALPLLSEPERAWLRDAVALAQPESPWLPRLGG